MLMLKWILEHTSHTQKLSSNNIQYTLRNMPLQMYFLELKDIARYFQMKMELMVEI